MARGASFPGRLKATRGHDHRGGHRALHLVTRAEAAVAVAAPARNRAARANHAVRTPAVERRPCERARMPARGGARRARERHGRYRMVARHPSSRRAGRTCCLPAASREVAVVRAAKPSVRAALATDRRKNALSSTTRAGIETMRGFSSVRRARCSGARGCSITRSPARTRLVSSRVWSSEDRRARTHAESPISRWERTMSARPFQESCA